MKQLFQRIDNPKSAKLVFIIFIIVWTGINIIQALFTELAHDEAYYWMYSNHLDWGYFDHPPMIALLIKLGTLISPSEIGIRIIPVLMGTTSMIFIYYLIPEAKNNILLFCTLCFSVLIMQSHIGSMLAIPDIPVVFFSVLFLWFYKKYLNKDSYILALVLGIIGACMLYSKYHGVLVLFFILIADIKLCKRLSFWIIPFVIILLMLPHLFWQIKNGFPTFEYHLISRSSAYTLNHTLNYLYSQLLIAGPLAGILLLFHGIKYKPGNQFEKSLKFVAIGFLVFFFLSSFKGHVEAHWTAIAYAPLFILAFKGINASKLSVRLVYIFILPSLLLVLLVRISIVNNFLKFKTNVPHEFIDWDIWADEIEQIAGNRKVVFLNTFQRPSKYTYYSGNFATSLNNFNYRKNQFDLWPFEDSLQGKEVLLIHPVYPEDTLYTCTGEKYPYRKLTDFKSYYNLSIETETKKIQTEKKSQYNIQLKLNNTRKKEINFTTEYLYKSALIYSFYEKGELYSSDTCFTFSHENIPAGGYMEIDTTIKLPEKHGRYQLIFSIRTRILPPAYNSRIIPVTIKN